MARWKTESRRDADSRLMSLPTGFKIVDTVTDWETQIKSWAEHDSCQYIGTDFERDTLLRMQKALAQCSIYTTSDTNVMPIEIKSTPV